MRVGQATPCRWISSGCPSRRSCSSRVWGTLNLRMRLNIMERNPVVIWAWDGMVSLPKDEGRRVVWAGPTSKLCWRPDGHGRSLRRRGDSGREGSTRSCFPSPQARLQKPRERGLWNSSTPNSGDTSFPWIAMNSSINPSASCLTFGSIVWKRSQRMTYCFRDTKLQHRLSCSSLLAGLDFGWSLGLRNPSALHALGNTSSV